MTKKILFVEDDAGFYGIFSAALEMKGYTVIHVPDGGQAVQKVLDEKPDLILLDIILPVLSGLDILRQLKENEETQNIKVIMLTNFGTDDNVKRAMELGADDYLMKYNVVPSELPDKVANILGEGGETDVKVTSL